VCKTFHAPYGGFVGPDEAGVGLGEWGLEEGGKIVARGGIQGIIKATDGNALGHAKKDIEVKSTHARGTGGVRGTWHGLDLELLHRTEVLVVDASLVQHVFKGRSQV
jgi:hypothetical protein